MKKFLLIGLVILTVCSCAKNYPKMVNDRVEQYQKEGKIILNQSNDSTGKEHYIVYADAKAQVIGVDALDGDVKEIHLGKKISKKLCLKVVEGKGLTAVFEDNGDDNWYVTSEGLISYEGPKKGGFPVDFVYKGKFLIFGINRILYFDKPETIHTVTYFKNEALSDIYPLVDKNGRIQVPATGFLSELPGKWQDYFSEEEHYIDRNHTEMDLDVIISPDGNIIGQGKQVNWSGIKIPTTAFSSWNSLEPYIRKLVKKEKIDNQSWWNCMVCGRIVKSDIQPENSLCNEREFWSGLEYMKLHRWIYIGGFSPNRYQCNKCGQRVETEDYPAVAHCPEGNGHVWTQL